MKSLHWFRHDLRVHDNPALKQINQDASELLCVYVLDEQQLEQQDFDPIQIDKQKGMVNLSQHRRHFLYQSLVDLDNNLAKLGQKLYVAYGDPVSVSSDLCKAHEIECVSSTWHPGVIEQEQWRSLQAVSNKQQYLQLNGNLLYEEADFPFSLENMPDTFSPFRRKVEKYCDVKLNTVHIDDFAPCVDTQYLFEVDKLNISEVTGEYTGGASAALARVQEYFWQTDNIAHYKETRNGFDGWDFSSRLSAWLALGCISPKQVLVELHDYEKQRAKNESTYWLFFELLWREFFYWQHHKHGARFFKKSGVQGKQLNTKFDHHNFNNWVNGTTGYPIVDACMRQLKDTGFMSNRGRQIVASCFVHELQQDWCYGAAYFEHQLVDFDVASNYGNWQYLAGVGSDPRGHRQFNLVKQAQHYDPDGSFVNAWLGK